MSFLSSLALGSYTPLFSNSTFFTFPRARRIWDGIFFFNVGTHSTHGVSHRFSNHPQSLAANVFLFLVPFFDSCCTRLFASSDCYTFRPLCVDTLDFEYILLSYGKVVYFRFMVLQLFHANFFLSLT